MDCARDRVTISIDYARDRVRSVISRPSSLVKTVPIPNVALSLADLVKGNGWQGSAAECVVQIYNSERTYTHAHIHASDIQFYFHTNFPGCEGSDPLSCTPGCPVLSVIPGRQRFETGSESGQ